MRRGLLIGFLVFIASAVALAAVVAVIGRPLFVRHAGAAAARAWMWGCGVSLAASLVSGALVSTSGRLGLEGVTVALGSMLARLGVLVLLAVAAVVTLELEPRPFLLGVALSYLALLVVDTLYALKIAAGGRNGALGERSGKAS